MAGFDCSICGRPLSTSQGAAGHDRWWHVVALRHLETCDAFAADLGFDYEEATKDDDGCGVCGRRLRTKRGARGHCRWWHIRAYRHLQGCQEFAQELGLAEEASGEVEEDDAE